jgi:hypothetical protein
MERGNQSIRRAVHIEAPSRLRFERIMPGDDCNPISFRFRLAEPLRNQRSPPRSPLLSATCAREDGASWAWPVSLSRTSSRCSVASGAAGRKAAPTARQDVRLVSGLEQPPKGSSAVPSLHLPEVCRDTSVQLCKWRLARPVKADGERGVAWRFSVSPYFEGRPPRWACRSWWCTIHPAARQAAMMSIVSMALRSLHQRLIMSSFVPCKNRENRIFFARNIGAKCWRARKDSNLRPPDS